jgi:Putative prokaryotic signal transducing protein
MVEIGMFDDFFAATMAKEILESNGIHCVVSNVNMSIIEIQPGAKINLIINECDREGAKVLLDSFFSDNKSSTGTDQPDD